MTEGAHNLSKMNRWILTKALPAPQPAPSSPTPSFWTGAQSGTIFVGAAGEGTPLGVVAWLQRALTELL